MPVKRKRKDFSWVGDGLVTLPRDAQKEMLEKGRLYSPNASNADFFRPGSSRKFPGFEQMGDDVLALGAKYDETVLGDPANRNFNITADLTYAIGLRWANADTRAAGSLTMRIGWSAGFSGSITAKLWADVAGPVPGAVLQSSNTIVIPLTGAARSPGLMTWIFPTSPALVVGNLWLGLEFTGLDGGNHTITLSQSDFAAQITATKEGGGGWAQVASAGLYALLNAADPPITGLWDVRFGDGAISQYYMTSCSGQLFAGDPDTVDGGGSWGDAVWEDGNTERLELWDLTEFGNSIFIADYGQNIPRYWDGVFGSDRTPAELDEDSTMQMGFKSPLTVARSGGASNWSAVGLVQVIIATALRSGGFRASYGSVTLQNINDDVDLSAMELSGAIDEFYFDVDALATTVYCTQPGRGIFYKVPVASMSNGANPVANSVTALTIAGTLDAALAAESDLESATGYPTGYFTRQVTAPKGKYLNVFSNTLVCGGVDGYPFSIFFSAQDAPNVWSEYGASYGVRLDIYPDDGEPVTGLHVADRALYVAKPHNLYRVDFTGDASDPWRVTRVHGGYGTSCHWSMQTIPTGLIFLDDSGPALCYGTYSALVPGADKILNIFDARSPDEELGLSWLPLSLPDLKWSSSVLETRFNRVRWMLAVGEESDAVKYVQLIYDYERHSFTVRTDQQFNVLASIGDANGFPSVWGGSYTDKVYRERSDFVGSVPQVIETPWLDLDEAGTFKDADWLWVRGERSTQLEPADQWSVLVWTDGPESVDGVTPNCQLSFYASLRDFSAGGLAIKLPPKAFRRIKLRFESPFGSQQADALEGFTIEYAEEGQRR